MAVDNYEVSRDRAQKYFLSFRQWDIIQRWDLMYDEDYIYLDFFGKPYGIRRATGAVSRFFDGSLAGFAEVMTIFDLLCHEGAGKYLSGKYAPVNSLKGVPKTSGVGTDFHTKTAALFDKHPEAFRKACLELKGTPVDQGDMAFRFPLFKDLSVILKLYHSDEDFPASITLLWDENTLQYMYYETVFYAAGFLLETISQKMGIPE